MKLQERGYQVARYQLPLEAFQPPWHMEDEANPIGSGKESSKVTGTLDKKHTNCSTPTKVHSESEDKDCSGCKHQDSKY